MDEAIRQTLRCPHCGAPLPIESVRQAVACAFCGTVSAPAAAPAFESASGGPASVATEAIAASSGACPRCRLPLFEGRANEIVMLGCGRCGGVWLDNDAAQRAVATLDAEVVTLAIRASSRASSAVNVDVVAACPACGQGMTRVCSPRSMVQIDVCAEHGTWFDRHELKAAFDAMRPGAIAPGPTTYNGPTPDFRAGANPELKQFAGIMGYGVLGMLSAVVGVGAAAIGAGAASAARDD